MPYHLEGRLLEVCDCRVRIPRLDRVKTQITVTCDSMQAWHFDKGHVNGIDMTGRTVGAAFHIPGNVLKGDFRAALYIDDGGLRRATSSTA